MASNSEIIFDAEQQRRAEQIIIGQAATAQNNFLTQLLTESLSHEEGRPVAAAELPGYMPRLLIRKYEDQMMIVVLDAEPDGRGGKMLFGFGPADLSFCGDKVTWAHPVYNAIECAAYLLHKKAAAAPKPTFEIDITPDPESRSRLNHHLRTCYGAGIMWPPL